MFGRLAGVCLGLLRTASADIILERAEDAGLEVEPGLIKALEKALGGRPRHRETAKGELEGLVEDQQTAQLLDTDEDDGAEAADAADKIRNAELIVHGPTLADLGSDLMARLLPLDLTGLSAEESEELGGSVPHPVLSDVSPLEPESVQRVLQRLPAAGFLIGEELDVQERAQVEYNALRTMREAGVLPSATMPTDNEVLDAVADAIEQVTADKGSALDSDEEDEVVQYVMEDLVMERTSALAARGEAIAQAATEQAERFLRPLTEEEMDVEVEARAGQLLEIARASGIPISKDEEGSAEAAEEYIRYQMRLRDKVPTPEEKEEVLEELERGQQVVTTSTWALTDTLLEAGLVSQQEVEAAEARGVDTGRSQEVQQELAAFEAAVMSHPIGLVLVAQKQLQQRELDMRLANTRALAGPASTETTQGEGHIQEAGEEGEAAHEQGQDTDQEGGEEAFDEEEGMGEEDEQGDEEGWEEEEEQGEEEGWEQKEGEEGEVEELAPLTAEQEAELSAAWAELQEKVDQVGAADEADGGKALDETYRRFLEACPELQPEVFAAQLEAEYNDPERVSAALHETEQDSVQEAFLEGRDSHVWEWLHEAAETDDPFEYMMY
ncbi:hypothetical protein HaLaN_13035, partial [Haematococcus lacustris]